MALETFCVITKNYLSHLRTTIESLKKFHPDVKFNVLILDSANGYFTPNTEKNCEFYEMWDVGLEGELLRQIFAEHSFFEIACMMKARFALYLFKTKNIEKMFYLDTDLFFLNSLSPCAKLLDQHNLILTPHLVSRNISPTRAEVFTEAAFYGTGFFNMGFFGIRNTPESIEFLTWWGVRTSMYCKRDIPKGFFDDQKWVDAVPSLFKGVHVLLDPGYNVANWNLAERPISQVKGKYMIEDNPLVFFHFSRFNPLQPYKLTQYLDIDVEDYPHLAEITEQYRTELYKNNWKKISQWPVSTWI